jgi:hypothetical protein
MDIFSGLGNSQIMPLAKVKSSFFFTVMMCCYLLLSNPVQQVIEAF